MNFGKCRKNSQTISGNSLKNLEITMENVQKIIRKFQWNLYTFWSIYKRILKNLIKNVWKLWGALETTNNRGKFWQKWWQIFKKFWINLRKISKNCRRITPHSRHVPSFSYFGRFGDGEKYFYLLLYILAWWDYDKSWAQRNSKTQE